MTTVDEILSGHSAEVRAISQALRALVHETLPGMTEKAYPGWHAIGFRHPQAGYVCGIFPFQSSVRLLFEHGVLLSDPEGALAGTGSQTRHLEFSTVGQIEPAAIVPFLREAYELRPTRKKR